MLLDRGITPVLAGTNIDRAAGDDLLASVVRPEEIVDLIGKTSLTGLAGLLRSAHVVIGNDTGPVFLSARLGTPTMMVMSSHTDPTMSAPYGPKARWIRHDNLADLPAEEVMAGLGEILS
jgi:ADP-heptose:LPS heptosyltransferase